MPEFVIEEVRADQVAEGVEIAFGLVHDDYDWRPVRSVNVPPVGAVAIWCGLDATPVYKQPHRLVIVCRPAPPAETPSALTTWPEWCSREIDSLARRYPDEVARFFGEMAARAATTGEEA